MRYLYIILLLGFFFVSSDSVYSQKKARKIETWEVIHSSTQWYYTNVNGYYNNNCIEKMCLTFQNYSNYKVKSISLILTIQNCEGTILYKKKHTLSVDLDPIEIAPSKVFKLFENVCDYQCGFSNGTNVIISTEILSVR